MCDFQKRKSGFLRGGITIRGAIGLEDQPLQAPSSTALAIIAWLFAVNVLCGVDAIVWATNLNIIWCDTSSSHGTAFFFWRT